MRSSASQWALAALLVVSGASCALGQTTHAGRSLSDQHSSSRPSPAGSTVRPRKPFFEFATDAPRAALVLGVPDLAPQLSKPEEAKLPRRWIAQLRQTVEPLLALVSPTTDATLPLPVVAQSPPLAATSTRVAEDTSSRVVSMAPASVSVDVARLTQHIVSHNLSVRAIEDLLDRRGRWNVAGLESVARQVAMVIEARALWDLYYMALSPPQRRDVPEPKSLTKTIALLQRRLYETELVVNSAAFDPSPSPKREIEERLSTLRRQLEDWETSLN